MKIKGAYVLTLRNIKRMIAVLATVFSMLCPAATTPDEVQLADRYAFASQCLMHMRGSLMSDADRIIVPDAQYREFKTLYLMKKPPRGEIPHVSGKGRRYSTRKTISIAMAARITGLGTSTIKRLDKDPKNTNYPGRNSSAKILAAWAQLYRGDKIAAREVRTANRPLHCRS